MSEETLFNEVESLMLQWKLEEATVLLERRLSQTLVSTRVFHSLSILYSQQGLFDLALDSIEKAMARNPIDRAIWCQYLALQKNNPEQPTDEAWKSMHLQFGDTFRERFDARHLLVPRSRDPDARLRVGYLSPDTHEATERFVQPVLQQFDKASFDVFSYWNRASSLGRRSIYQDVHHRSIEGLQTEDIVELLMSDRIDILVDVAGHGAGNALPTLAYRPAPIQMTWLDYLATTGLETVDYRISDWVADPVGAEARHVESILRLPVPQWCYCPPRELTEDARPDVVSKCGVVYGSICVPLKLSEPLLKLWARLLAQVPSGRLRFLGIPEGRARTRIVSFFDRAGIAADRLDIIGRLSLAQFLSELSGIDVVLDSYPFSGATATLDALWQGVPVVTLAGRLSHSRSGASILAAMRKPQWVACCEDEYLEIAGRLSTERCEHPYSRAGIRADLSQSALCDGKRFMKALESAYRWSWKERLQRTESIDSALRYTNSRADVLLNASGTGASRCLELQATLPAHKVTGQLFWKEFRAEETRRRFFNIGRVALREIADIVLLNGETEIENVLRHGTRPWIVMTYTMCHVNSVIERTLPSDAIAECDALAAFGADAMPHGSLLAAGRGHTGGLTATADGNNDKLYARLWVPHRMRNCTVLSGPLLLVRRLALDGHRLPRSSFKCDVDFATAVSQFTFELHRSGARLGIAAALAVPLQADPSPADQFQNDRALARETCMESVPQTDVAASALKAIIPTGAWPAFVRRAEQYCDHRPTARTASPSCV